MKRSELYFRRLWHKIHGLVFKPDIKEFVKEVEPEVPQAIPPNTAPIGKNGETNFRVRK